MLKKILYLLFPLAFILYAGCDFIEGWITDPRVYLAFKLDDHHMPDADTFFCDALRDYVNVQDGPASLEYAKVSKYYVVEPDTYHLEYGYAELGVTYEFDFTVRAYNVTLGKENSYYDLYIRRDVGPALLEFPAESP